MFRSWGVRVGVRVNHASVLPDLLPLLPPASAPARGPVVDALFSLHRAAEAPGARVRRFHLLYGDGERLERTLDAQELLDGFEGHVKLSVAERATRWVFLHAGVVGWRGGAIVVPGRSHSGKSRLVEALVRRGATYYSDEYAILDAEGLVHAYPAPISLRDEGGGRRRVMPDAAPRRNLRPLPVRRVLLTRYRPDARWRPRTLSPGRALLGMLDHAVPARLRPADVISVLRRLAASAQIERGERGDADAVAAALLAS